MQEINSPGQKMHGAMGDHGENGSDTGTYAFPLSFAQQRLWFLYQYEPDSPIYHTGLRLYLRGNLDVAALQTSLDQLVARHEILRTTFVMRGGEPVQIVSPPGSRWSPITVYERPEWAELDEGQRIEQIADLFQSESRSTFDMEKGPLLRVTLIRMSPSVHAFQIVRHHIITDARSSQVFWRELAAIYNAQIAGRPHDLPTVSLQYADFAVWQRELLQGAHLEKELGYWREQLHDSQPLNLPTDYPHPTQPSYQGGSQRFILAPELATALKSLAVNESASLFMTLLAAYYVLLYRYSQQGDISVGTPIANRNRQELEGVMGLFLNTLVLRARPAGEMSFRQLLRHVRALSLEAYQHQDIPFEKLIEELNPPRTLNRHPLFQTMFVLNQERELEQGLHGLTIERIQAGAGMAKFDLTVFFSEEDGRLHGHFNYATDLFEASTVERMVGHFQVLLAGIVADPDCPIAELPLLTVDERRQILVEWAGAAGELPDIGIHRLVEAQSLRTPHQLALETDDGFISFTELNSRANRLAHLLRSRGVRCGDPVGIFVSPDVSTMVALLAILKAGAVYVPFDCEQPAVRLGWMIEHIAPKVLLHREGDDLSAVPGNMHLERINLDRAAVETLLDSNLDVAVSANDAAYILFTSGSTGRPKAVQIPHRTLTNLARWQQRHPRLGKPARTLQISSLMFDVSLQEILTTWTVGGAIVLPHPDLRRDPRQLLRAITQKRIQRLFLPYVLLQLLADSAVQESHFPATLHDLITAGETLRLTTSIRTLMRNLPHCRLHNHYGPTESHLATAETLTEPIDAWPAEAPIGRPITNTQIYLFDLHLQPVPIGVPGELYIGGAGLAIGYLNQPDLTAERFIPHPFSDDPDARLYRTGDLARYREDGVIEFLGRADRQLKIRGFRVEPGEIEAVLREHPAVQDGLVNVLEDGALGKRLAAWWVARNGEAPNETELRSFLRQRLPEYMLPGALVRVHAFPLTPSGKVDRSRLPQPDSQSSHTAVRGPQTQLERQLLSIWAQVLDAPNLSVEDNFFEAGGHSLLAVRLIDRVERATGRNLTVASLFHGPTVADQAALLEQEGWTPPWRSLVPVQPRGSRPPLFLVPPAGSTSVRFARLANILGDDQPIYGFDPVGLDGESPPLTSVEAMAAHFVSELCQFQPDGPYLLGGMCFGGHVAFEMARQLEYTGRTAPMVVLLDVSQPSNGPTWSLPPRNGLYYLRRTIDYRRHGYALDAVQRFLRSKWTRLSRRLMHWSDPALHKMGAVYNGQLTAIRDYYAEPARVKLVHFQSDDGLVNARQLKWSELTDDLEIVHFPGTTHRSLLLEDDNISRIAEELAKAIDRWAETNW